MAAPPLVINWGPGGYPGPKDPNSNSDWGITDWKDVVMPGGSRNAVAAGTPGSAPDIEYYTGTPMGRMDWIDGGAPGEDDDDYISGSGSADGSGRTTRASIRAVGPSLAAPGASRSDAGRSSAVIQSFNRTLGGALQNYLAGGANDQGIARMIASMQALGQKVPDFSAVLGSQGIQLSAEQIKRLQELAARMSLQQTVLPSNIA